MMFLFIILYNYENLNKGKRAFTKKYKKQLYLTSLAIPESKKHILYNYENLNKGKKAFIYKKILKNNLISHHWP